ncbi:MAG: hypothetical protein IT353_11510 [Gemmatimonadaceae bacterium]|nr:hypothetical protein [Gemmatimonadaceae bacterium]
MSLLLPCLLRAQQTATDRSGHEQWADPRADSLVERATQRRSVQLADSTLLSYRADARGFLAFLAQLGEGVIVPPKVVQSEELALSIAWWQPNRSAQQLVGRRDTTLLPASVGYYRDRYGVILDNLPDRIRLGDGQDVRDVPHPLAASARALYEFRLVTPVRIRLPGREIVVDEVQFRPRNASQPAAIGSVFLDRETAAVVRLSMTFTRAAILDKRIETLVVTLENGLVRERYWLPRRQEVEVSRGSTWMDIPVRGIVRGRWEVSNYDVNEQVPAATQRLPRWSSVSADSLKKYPFTDRIVDMLPPEIQIASTEDVVHAREQAELLVRSSMLARPARTAVSGRSISDGVRYNRSEGLALGVGASQRWGAGWLLTGRVRYGIDDREVKGQVSLGRAPAFGRVPLFQLFAERDYRELAQPERSGVANSLGALLFGGDYTQQVDTRAAGIIVRRSPRDPFTLRVAYEEDAPLSVTARSLRGDFGAAVPAWRTAGVRAEVRGVGGWVPTDDRPTRGTWSLLAAAGASHGTDGAGHAVAPRVLQVQGSLMVQRLLPGDRAIVTMTSIGVSGGRDLPPQWLHFAGGPTSAPGYDAAALASRAILSQRLEVRQPIPAPRIPLGKYGKAPGRITLAPYAQVAVNASGISAMPSRVSAAWPSAGVGALFFFDLLRFDAARGLRDGVWRFAIDIDRNFWSVL